MQQCGYGRLINIEEYVGSLIKDPDFTTALAEAVARTITDQHKQQQDLNLNLDLPERWNEWLLVVPNPTTLKTKVQV